VLWRIRVRHRQRNFCSSHWVNNERWTGWMIILSNKVNNFLI
jgi:hypothetical protein